MAENLKKTLLIEETEYNINAVHADNSDEATHAERSTTTETADKTQAKLTLIQSIDGNNNYPKVEFDGESAKTITYVPADGGTFTGNIHIHSGNKSLKDITDNDIINKGQMETVISQLNGAPLYTWNAGDDVIDPDSEVTTIKTGYNAVEYEVELDDGTKEKVPFQLNTVIGSVEDLPVFEAYSNGQAHNLYVTPDSYDNAYITYGTYKDAYFNQAYNDIKGSITKLVFPNTYIDKGTGEKKSVVKIRYNEFTANTSQNYGFTNLVTVHINPDITEIDNNAFSGCEKLTSVAIPDSVTRIGLNTFSGCTGLTNVVLGSNISTIDAGAFSNCTSLTSIAICNSSVKIVKAKKVSSTTYLDAFSGCKALAKVYFKGSQEEWNTLVDEAGLDSNNPLRSATIVSISDTAFPFLYICKGPKGEDTSLTSNKMFLKLPDEDLVEISKGAARLERRDSKTSGNVDYFTYDVLAAVIAGINSRITALGSQALALPETLKVYDSETTAVVNIPTKIANENISTGADKKLLVEETAVASVTQLQEQITKITNGTYLDTDYSDTVLKAKADETGRNIQAGYYQKTQNDYTSDSSANTITISNSIPTSTTPGSIGDIMIVINTGDGEYK